MDKFRYVIHLIVNDHPKIIFFVVLPDLGHRDLPWSHVLTDVWSAFSNKVNRRAEKNLN